MSLNIERVEISTLQPDPKNARTHGRKNLAAIQTSLERFGQVEPLVVQASTGRVIGGNGRLEVLRAMGVQQVDIVRVEVDDAQATALGIALNRSGDLAGWNDARLEEALRSLSASGDLAGVGFTDYELAKLLGSPHAEETPPELPAESYVQPGQLWRLGEHLLLCGDSTQPSCIDALMQGERAQLCWTDPPWGAEYTGVDSHYSKTPAERRPIANDSLSEPELEAFAARVVGQLDRVLEPGAPVYMVTGNASPAFGIALRRGGFHWSSTIVWVKDMMIVGRKDYHGQHETIWYGWKEGAGRLVPVVDRGQSDVWNIARPKRSEAHPTTKPVELVRRALLNSSKRGALVYEPFSGSGSTIVACEQAGRRCRAIELEPRYVQVAIERWQTLTSQKAHVMTTLAELAT